MWEKEKLLINRIFSFSHNVFYPFKDKFCQFELTVICRLQLLSIWTSLRFCHTKQIETMLGTIIFSLSSNVFTLVKKAVELQWNTTSIPVELVLLLEFQLYSLGFHWICNLIEQYQWKSTGTIILNTST